MYLFWFWLVHVVFTCTCRISKLYREGGTEEEFENTKCVYTFTKDYVATDQHNKTSVANSICAVYSSVTHRQSIFSFPFYITCTNSFVPFSSASIPHHDNMHCSVAQKMYQGVR